MNGVAYLDSALPEHLAEPAAAAHVLLGEGQLLVVPPRARARGQIRAVGLGRAAAKGRGVSLDAVVDRGRDGITGARKRGAIGFAALRGGDVVGDHSVIFAADGERLELTHKSASRQTYARGALKAAAWARGKASGLYTMADVMEFGS